MFLTFLTIVGVGTVLAVVVLLDEERIHGQVGIDGEGNKRHLGTLLHHLSIVNCIVG